MRSTVRRYRYLFGFLLVWCVFAGTLLYGTSHALTAQARKVNDQATELKRQALELKRQAEAQEQRNRALEKAQCQSRKDGRDALRQVIIKSFQSGGAPHFEMIPSFADVEPGARRFLLDYEHQLATATPEQKAQLDKRRDDVLALVPPVRSCS